MGGVFRWFFLGGSVGFTWFYFSHQNLFFLFLLGHREEIVLVSFFKGIFFTWSKDSFVSSSEAYHSLS